MFVFLNYNELDWFLPWLTREPKRTHIGIAVSRLHETKNDPKPLPGLTRKGRVKWPEAELPCPADWTDPQLISSH